MRTSSDFCSMLGIEHPIILAPMAGSTTPELIAAVSNAGGLGMLGAANMTPARITEEVAAIRALTDRPFGVNLFAGGREDSRKVDPDGMIETLTPLHEEFGLAAPETPEAGPDPFPDAIEAILAAQVPVFSFTFGIPAPEVISALHEQGVTVIGTATTVEEARMLVAAGADAVVAQGAEAGGHRGTFAGPFDEAMIGTMVLVPQVVDAVAVPVIASGGIMDGRGIAAAQALGASAVQMGTAFLTTTESGAPQAHKDAIRSARSEQVSFTRAFSGRPARAITNEFIEAWRGRDEDILPFPLQNTATRALRNEAAARGDARYLSLWSGQGVALARDLSATDLVRHLIQEADDVRSMLS